MKRDPLISQPFCQEGFDLFQTATDISRKSAEIESTTEHLYCVCPGCGREILDDDLDYDNGDNGYGALSLPETFNCGHCSKSLCRDDIKFPDMEY